MKQSVICRCDGRDPLEYFCEQCGGLIMPNKTPDASPVPSGMGKGPTTSAKSPSASDRTRGENTDWMTCPTCNVTGHLDVRNCKTWCGSCKSLISTCADL